MMTLEFPRLVYKDGGKLERPGGTYSHKCVDNEDEYRAALSEGWHDSLNEALAPKEPKFVLIKDVPEGIEQRYESVPESNEWIPPLRVTLEEQARALKVRFHPSISDGKLLEKIDRAIAEQNKSEKPANLTNEAN